MKKRKSKELINKNSLTKRKPKIKRGRPPGSKNKPKISEEELINIIQNKSLDELKTLEKEFTKKK